MCQWKHLTPFNPDWFLSWEIPTYLVSMNPIFTLSLSDIPFCQKWTRTPSVQLLEGVWCPYQRCCNSLPTYSLTPCRRSSKFLYLHSPAHICLSLAVKIRTWEGDFILHWSMKTFYKYIATAGTLIALAILIWLFCCGSQHMEGRKRERMGKDREWVTGCGSRGKEIWWAL